MEQCGICLSNSKKLITAEETEKNTCISYADMITSIAGLENHIEKNNIDKVCRVCCKKLSDCYNFKLLITRNVTSSRFIDNPMKLYFNTLEDIKIKIEIDGDELLPMKNKLVDKFDKTNIISYGHTVIKKNMNGNILSLPVRPVVVDNLELLIDEEDISDNDVINEFDKLDDLNDGNQPSYYEDGDYMTTWDEMTHMYSDNNDDDSMSTTEKYTKNGGKENKRYNTRHSKKATSHIEDTDTGSDDDYIPILEKYEKMKKKMKKQENCEKMEKEQKIQCYTTQSWKKIKDIDIDDDYIPERPIFEKSGEQENRKPQKKRFYAKKTESTKVSIKPVYLRNCNYALIYPPPRKSIRRKKAERSRICPHCGIVVESGMDHHLKKHRPKVLLEKKYKCEFCGKGHGTEMHLKRHIVTHGPKTFKCDHCVAAFWLKGSLTSHMKGHSDEKKYACETCGRRFKRRCAMRRHAITHDISNKKFRCDQCDMTFWEMCLLRQHMRVHTRERPHLCEICAQPYSYKRDFNRHCFNKHGVFLKHRLVRVMNQEVLEREIALTNELKRRLNDASINDVANPYEGPTGFNFKAFETAVQALKTGTAKF